MAQDDDTKPPPPLSFPHSRTAPSQTPGGFKDLGVSSFAK